MISLHTQVGHVLQGNMAILTVSGCEERDGTSGFVQLCWPCSIPPRLAELRVTDSFNWQSELSALSD